MARSAILASGPAASVTADDGTFKVVATATFTAQPGIYYWVLGWSAWSSTAAQAAPAFRLYNPVSIVLLDKKGAYTEEANKRQPTGILIGAVTRATAESVTINLEMSATAALPATVAANAARLVILKSDPLDQFVGDFDAEETTSTTVAPSYADRLTMTWNAGVTARTYAIVGSMDMKSGPGYRAQAALKNGTTAYGAATGRFRTGANAWSAFTAVTTQSLSGAQDWRLSWATDQSGLLMSVGRGRLLALALLPGQGWAFGNNAALAEVTTVGASTAKATIEANPADVGTYLMLGSSVAAPRGAGGSVVYAMAAGGTVDPLGVANYTSNVATVEGPVAWLRYDTVTESASRSWGWQFGAGSTGTGIKAGMHSTATVVLKTESLVPPDTTKRKTSRRENGMAAPMRDKGPADYVPRAYTTADYAVPATQSLTYGQPDYIEMLIRRRAAYDNRPQKWSDTDKTDITWCLCDPTNAPNDWSTPYVGTLTYGNLRTPDAALATAVASITRVIERTCNVGFRKVTAYADADVRIYQCDFTSTDDFLGYCYTLSQSNNEYIKLASVYLNENLTGSSFFGVDADSKTYGTIVHEFFHAMGLKHPFDAAEHVGAITGYTKRNTIMSYGTDNFRRARTAMPFDIAALRYLYGPPADDGLVQQIDLDVAMGLYWASMVGDAGLDVVDAMNISVPVEIDLRPGQISAINGIECLAVAFGNMLDDAYGGAGDDVLIGNALDNALKGRAGADVLMPGLGIDTMEGGEGADVYRGTLADLDGDTITDFEEDELIVVEASYDIAAGVRIDGADQLLHLYTGANLAVLRLIGKASQGRQWRVALQPTGSLVYLERPAPIAPPSDPGPGTGVWLLNNGTWVTDAGGWTAQNGATIGEPPPPPPPPPPDPVTTFYWTADGGTWTSDGAWTNG